jgi:hypothetical protein
MKGMEGNLCINSGMSATTLQNMNKTEQLQLTSTPGKCHESEFVDS